MGKREMGKKRQHNMKKMQVQIEIQKENKIKRRKKKDRGPHAPRGLNLQKGVKGFLIMFCKCKM